MRTEPRDEEKSSLLETLGTVNPGCGLAATAVNSRIYTGTRWDGTVLSSSGTVLWDMEERAAAAKLPRNAGAPNPIQAQSSAAHHAPGSKYSCALCPRPQDVRYLLLASAFKLFLKAPGEQELPLLQSSQTGASRTAGAAAPASAVPPGTPPAPGLVTRDTGLASSSRVDLPPGAEGRGQGMTAKAFSCMSLACEQAFGSFGLKQDNRLYYPVLN